MTPEQLQRLIDAGETLDVEFKGEDRVPLSDRDLVEAIVCLSNRRGQTPGVLLIGVEDDGRVTGARPRHGSDTDPRRVEALVANRTRPPVACRFELLLLDGRQVLVGEVPVSAVPVGTSDGKHVRRALNSRGEPECVPFPFHEMQSRMGDLGKFDFSAQTVAEAHWSDLDPLEFERFRRTIRESGRGDVSLLDLGDVELAKALDAVEANHEVTGIRTLALLLFGKDDALRRFLPSHEAAFQVLRGTDVEVNDFFRWPLIRLMEECLARFRARNKETELMVDLLRIGVPDYPPKALREGLANALIHRDYGQLGAVHVQWHDRHLEISNPGGFPEGVTLRNLLVTPPRPRNPLLADAFKRAGLVERTARGIDTIFFEQLRNGRPAPSYEQSTSVSVVLNLPGGEANLNFVRLVVEEGQSDRPVDLDQLLILNQLWSARSISTSEAAALIQKPATGTRGSLQRLVEAGLVEARGSGRARRWHLSASTYEALGQPAAYVRQRSFDPIQHEQMIHTYLSAHGRITRGEAADLCRASPYQASRLLRRLVVEGKLQRHGRGKGTWYGPAD